MPGIALLVPGSIGYRSLEAFLSQDTDHGVESAFRMFLVGIALVAGLLFSNSVVGERNAPEGPRSLFDLTGAAAWILAAAFVLFGQMASAFRRLAVAVQAV